MDQEVSSSGKPLNLIRNSVAVQVSHESFHRLRPADEEWAKLVQDVIHAYPILPQRRRSPAAPHRERVP